jgi:hypothetical protein
MVERDDVENAPEEVQAVHKAMMENARQRWTEEEMEYLRPVYTHRGDKDGVWSYRGGRADKTMPGGFEEAMSNAKIFFTG